MRTQNEKKNLIMKMKIFAVFLALGLVSKTKVRVNLYSFTYTLFLNPTKEFWRFTELHTRNRKTTTKFLQQRNVNWRPVLQALGRMPWLMFLRSIWTILSN